MSLQPPPQPKPNREPFPGAYWVGLLITLGLLLLVVLIGSTLDPGLAGLLVALALGVTVNPIYARWFLLAGLACAVLGFLGSDPQVAWGGVGLIASQLVVMRWGKR